MSNIPKLLRTIYAVLALALFMATGMELKAQTYLESFGQNRVQYRKFSWRYYDTRHFRVYHYDAAGRKLAKYVSEQAESDIKVIERKLGGQFPKRFNIIVYNSYDEYRQTNIGLKNDDHEQLDNNAGGTIDLVGDKLVVYYTGVHTDLRRQMRQGMAHVVMERMIFGENFRQMVKNAVLLNMPAWTTTGFIAYLVDGWDPQANSEWKNLLEARPKAGFHDLSEQYPELAGKAFWKFIYENYGENNVKNLLYTMQKQTSLNQGTKMVLDLKIKKAYDSCMAFYKTVYAADAEKAQAPDSANVLIEIPVPKDRTVIRNIRVSPKGKDVAYVSWKDGEYKVYIQNTQKEQNLSLMLEGGRQDYNEQQPDPDYPQLAWSNNGYKLAIMYRKGTQTRLRIYDALKARVYNYVIPKNRFDRVLGLTFMEEDDKLVFSAIRKSQTDLYQFTIKGSKLTYITNDIWDDTQPFFVSGGSRKGILFLSNRPKPNLNVPLQLNELPTGPMNVYFYNTTTQRPELLQCSNITIGNITQPIQYGPDNFAYLYDSSGIRNQYIVVFGRDARNMDSAISIPVTNYPQNIISHQYNPGTNNASDVLQSGKTFKVYYKKLIIPGVNANAVQPMHTRLDQPAPDLPANTSFMDSANAEYSKYEKGYRLDPLVKSGNTFQGEFANDTTQSTAAVHEDTVKPLFPEEAEDTSTGPDSTYLKLRSKQYMLSFKPDFFSVKVDNSVLFTQYQSYQGGGGEYTNPALGGMVTVSLNDLMENNRFTGGFRIPINFSGLTYFMQYQNFAGRVDWGLLFLHSESYNNYNVTYVDANNVPVAQKEQLGKNVTNMVQGSAAYPLDRIRSVRMNLGLRQDVLNFKATDTLSLSFDLPHKKQYWLLSRVEYVFDNTLSPTMNIRKGFRYKFFCEGLYGLNNAAGGGFNAGTDFRYYTPIYKNTIFASRLAYAHSGGKEKILYYLGGVDNWINPQYSHYVPAGNGDTYAFQAIATNLRGYEQNTFNGNNYAVANLELRLPVLNTFLKRPIQSTILKNLQLIGFADAGSAWTGFLPNAKNTERSYIFPTQGSSSGTQFNNVSLTLTVPGNRALGVGYGAGMRTTLLGYFMRLDAAWNVDGRKKPIWYFSLGTDF